MHGKTIKDFILTKLFNSNTESEKAAMTELEELLLSRINQAKQSPVSYKTIQEITDNVLREAKS